MTPLSQYEAHWPEISALLDEALNLPSTDHAAWIAGLTGQRAAHREALAALLAHRAEVETDDFLVDGPKLDNVADLPGARLGEGAQVGPYRLISEIARGGMGTVWLAERSDGTMKRRIALKLPRAVWGDAFAERMEREREILASLEHEHIARLYDAGIDAQGRPFLAMEYVEGEPIDAYCRTRALPVRERVALLLQVMAAVGHAHSRLVVHRDLKPSNILVTQDARVKLLDFGIAKLLEGDATIRTALTELSGRALTLDYASPEQIRGEPLGTASDVYSMAVVGYELLADARPYRLKRGSAAEIEEAIASAEPLRASDIAASPVQRQALRGDLDAILNRALKKAVAERYPSVDAFAQDLQRYLDGEPVQARPDRAAYRAAKFVGRHRLAVAMGTTLALSVLGGGAVAVWQAQVARAQERRATSELGRQRAVLDLYVETMARLSVVAAEQPASLSSPGAVTSVLQAKLRELGGRTAYQPGERSAQLEATMLQLNFDGRFEDSLAVGREYLAHLLANGAPAAQVILAYTAIGRNLFMLGRHDECATVRRAGADWAPSERDRDTAITRMHARVDLAGSLLLLGRRGEALSVLARADEELTRDAADGHLRFYLLTLLSVAQLGFDDVQALRYMREAHAEMLANGSADPDETSFLTQHFGNALLANGLLAEAEAVFGESLDVNRREHGRDSRNVVQAFGRFVSAVERRDPTRASSLIEAERRELEAGPHGVPAAADLKFGALRLEIAWLTGDADAARKVALPDDAKLLAPEALRNNETSLIDAARARLLLGRAAEAVRLIEAMRAAWPAGPGPTAPWLRIQETLAEAQIAAGQPEAAGKTADDLMQLLDQQHALAGRAYRVATSFGALAAVRRGDRDEATRLLDRLAQASPPFPSPVERADCELRRAEALIGSGRVQEGAAVAREALRELEGQHPASPRLALAQRLMARAAASAGM